MTSISGPILEHFRAFVSAMSAFQLLNSSFRRDRRRASYAKLL